MYFTPHFLLAFELIKLEPGLTLIKFVADLFNPPFGIFCMPVLVFVKTEILIYRPRQISKKILIEMCGLGHIFPSISDVLGKNLGDYLV